MIQFHLKSLLAEKERAEGGKVTYRDIQEATGINLNTLSAIANNRSQQIHLSTISRLCDYFGCKIENLMTLSDEIDPQQKFRRQLYKKISQRIDQQRLLPEPWSLPGYLDYAIRIEITGIPKDEIRALFYIFKDDTLGVGVSIKSGDQQKNQEIFKLLQARKSEIEAAFGHAIAWESPTHIRYELPLQYLGRQGRWPEIQDEMIAAWERLLEAFKTPLDQIWQAYEPVRKEFIAPDIIRSGEEGATLSIDRKIKEYSKVVTCIECLGDSKMIREEKDDLINLPQAGHIGRRYEQHRVVLIAQNPGYPKPTKTVYHKNYAEAEQDFFKDPTRDNMETLQNTLEQAMPHWTIYTKILSPLLTRCDLALDDIAYFNAVRCPTKNNRTPSAAMTANCSFHLEYWLEWLQPRVVVCIGKMVYREIEPLLTARNIPHTYLNRDRSLSGPERIKNLDEISQVIRSRIGKSDEITTPPLDSQPVQPKIDVEPGGEPKTIGIALDREREPVKDMAGDLTVEEQLALAKIKSPTLKTVYLELIEFSKNLQNVAAKQIKSGSKLSFRYYAGQTYAFSFITNQYHLLFYVRGLALRNLPHTEELLQQNNIPFQFNPSGDLQIRIADKGPLPVIKQLLADYYSR